MPGWICSLLCFLLYNQYMYMFDRTVYDLNNNFMIIDYFLS